MNNKRLKPLSESKLGKEKDSCVYSIFKKKNLKKMHSGFRNATPGVRSI